VSNGEIVYSTCSLEPEENEFNMDWAIKNLDLEIQEINCMETGLTNIFGKQLDPTVNVAGGFGPMKHKDSLYANSKRGVETNHESESNRLTSPLNSEFKSA
jgi:16S rRNA C967 or C1407 C5-methylase (RsmB/RsmF family)